MNHAMAYGAEQRLDAQIADALFGQPGMSKMDVANRVRELRGDGPALLVGVQGDALASLQQEYDRLMAAFDRQVEAAEKIAATALDQDDRIEELEAALSAQPSPSSIFDLEGMLAACVPGGDIADPQVIADNIRHWFAAQPSPSKRPAHCPVKHCGMTYARVPADGRCHACGATVQPSPGGQGESLSISDDDRAVLQRLQDALPTAGINGWAKGVEVLERLLRDSLAARQPEGATVKDSLTVAARQPVCPTCEKEGVFADDGSGSWDCYTCGKKAAARQPVGEPVGYFDPDVLAHLTEGLIDPVGVLRRKSNGKSNVPVWLGPPAQAVDLGQFNALAALANAVVHHGGESPMKNGVFAEAERLLALIDGKAVGK